MDRTNYRKWLTLNGGTTKIDSRHYGEASVSRNANQPNNEAIQRKNVAQQSRVTHVANSVVRRISFKVLQFTVVGRLFVVLARTYILLLVSLTISSSSLSSIL